MSAARVGDVAGVVSLAAPGAPGLAAGVRDQGAGAGERPGRVPPLREDEQSATTELLLHCAENSRLSTMLKQKISTFSFLDWYIFKALFYI